MRKTYYLLLISLLIFACSKNQEYGNSEIINKYEFTDFQSVVKNPKEFYKDTLRIKGQITMSSHNVSITDGKSWIWIDSFEPAVDYDTVYQNLNMRDVELIGVFDFREKGFMDSYDGKFTELFYIKTE
ncbi:hypothetical protein [uncultured Psychroserpens sp.]|uniref:hypothetical protein n=1 Tax=uncultured Psychroserpens sp. TaxID=255436 RepID=UPI0026270AFE|nr:hypothetical protein [uncultured Psychroserpens sp.]